MLDKGKEILILLVLITCYSFGQNKSKPKEIKRKGDYTHADTKFVFPESFETYRRQGIYSFNKENSNIGVLYEKLNDNQNTKVSIYVYPAGGEGAESRLIHEFQQSIQAIVNANNSFNAKTFPVKHEGEFICNGLKAISKTNQYSYDNLTLYECGTWFLKIRLTSNEIDSIQVETLEKKVLEQYKPSALTKLKPLITKANVYFARSAFVDSLFLGSVMGSAYRKIDWAEENLKENEKQSGFPDIYLDMHIQSMKELLQFQKDHPEILPGLASEKYLDEVGLIVNSGFLEEFIMEQFQGLLRVPDGMKLDFKGYERWKVSNAITIDLNKKRHYVISYGKR